MSPCGISSVSMSCERVGGEVVLEGLVEGAAAGGDMAVEVVG